MKQQITTPKNIAKSILDIPEDYDLYTDPDFINLKNENGTNNLSGQHTLSIRYQLWLGRKAYKQRMGSNAWGTPRILKELNAIGIQIEKQALIALYNPSIATNNINLTAVLKLCEIWDLDVEKVLALPNEHKLRKSETYDDGWKVFTDKRYGGKYYCYFLQLTGDDRRDNKQKFTLRKKETLIKATLDIQISGPNRATAIFEYYNPTSGIQKRKYASCTPMISKLNNVYLDFTDNDGRVYKISFDYRDFPSSGDCYFRIASMLTEGSDQNHFPLFQKVLLFRNELDSSYDDYVRGLLNLTEEIVLVHPQKVEELTEDPLIQEFKENFCTPMENTLTNNNIEKGSVIPLHHLHTKELPVSTSSMSQSEVQQALLKLRSSSYCPSQILVADDSEWHRIAKKMQNYVASDPEEHNE